MLTRDEKNEIVSLINEKVEMKHEIVYKEIEKEFLSNVKYAERITTRDLAQMVKILVDNKYVQCCKVNEEIVLRKYDHFEDQKNSIVTSEFDKTVYAAIEKSKGQGLSKTELKYRTGLENNIISKSLDKFEKFNLTKKVKSKNKNRYNYMLFDIDPDDKVTGGMLYEKGEIDTNLVKNVIRKIKDVQANKGKATFQELSNFLSSNKTDDKDLTENDIKTLINVLIFDDAVEMIVTDDGTSLYQLSSNERAFAQDILTELPCTSCPVFSECKVGGNISPENCIYLNDW